MELLIAVSIFSVIALCLYSVFSGGIRIWKRQEEGFVYNHSVRLAFDSMAGELRNAINYSQPGNTGLDAEAAQGLKFSGDGKSLTFTTLIGGEIAKVDYVFEETADKKGRLIRKIVFQKEGFKEENQKDNILIEGLEDLAFEYAYKASGEEPLPVWKDSWAKEAQNTESKIPQGVRITLTFPGPGEGKEEIFRKTVFIPTGTFEEHKEL